MNLGKISHVLAALCLTISLVLCVATAAGDTVKLKDGTVLEGTITREGDKFVYIQVKIGSITQEKFVMREQIEKIERDADAKTGAGAEMAGAASAEKKTDSAAAGSKVTRVAVLNFGPPSSWQGSAGGMVGLHISAHNFASVIPILEREKIDVVVIRVNSGGGYGSEMPKFHNVFMEYQKKFRTVTWIESAISCAAMSPWVIREQYMMPHGNIGACTGWYGRLVAVKGAQLEDMLYQMEKASEVAGRDPRIMRAMQILETPLSASVDPVTGLVTFFSDEYAGDIRLNSAHSILTLTADQAEKIKFSGGTAATLDELMKLMGIQEYEVGAEQAGKKIDEYMRNATRLEKTRDELLTKYFNAVQAAGTLGGDENKTQRGAQVGIARRHLNELRSLININPEFAQMEEGGLPPEWFEEQERMLRQLAQ